MKNRLSVTFCFLVLGALLMAPMASAVCTDAQVAGTYGFHRFGVSATGLSVDVISSVGQFVADGAGHITSISEVISDNLTIRLESFSTGSYNVRPDCTGSLLLRSSVLSTQVNLNFVLEEGNTELHFVDADQGTTIWGVAELEEPLGVPLNCSLATLAGPWGEQSFGLYLNLVSRSILNFIADEGLLTFDGFGNAQLSDGTASTNLSVAQGITSFRGTYTVNPNCTGTITLPNSAPGQNSFPTIYYALTDNSTKMLFINISVGPFSAGSISFGTALRQ